MDITHFEASVDTHADTLDRLARSLHKRLPRRRMAGLLAAALASGALGRGANAAERATSIPPNCIYVCCDGTCDSWKMCMRCVKWPKQPTTATVTAG